jgi:two-component system, chemotaxis family, CheB/CheR fusion protein
MGIGIDVQHLSRIFEPFFTTKRENGTGLSLWVSMGIINRAGGFIRVWSTRRPGRSGTCFSIFLPAELPVTEIHQRRRYEAAKPQIGIGDAPPRPT